MVLWDPQVLPALRERPELRGPQVQLAQWVTQAPPALPALPVLREQPEPREPQARKVQWAPQDPPALPVPPLPLLPGLMLLRLPTPTM